MADTITASVAATARMRPASKRNNPYAATSVSPYSTPNSGVSADHEMPETRHTAAVVIIR